MIKRSLRIFLGFLTFKKSYYEKLLRPCYDLFKEVIPPRYKRAAFLYFANMNLFGNYLIYKSRKGSNNLLKEGDPRNTYEYFSEQRWNLLKKIYKISMKEWKQYSYAHYLYGFPYQTMGILNMFGGRNSEERFQEYELFNYLNKDFKILDLGANCGFMGILASYRLGCKVVGVDINPYSIEIGQSCLDLLGLKDLVRLETGDLKNIEHLPKDFDGVFAFAAQWTADGNNRIDLKTFLFYLASFLKPGGYIFFESHIVDMNDKSFLKVVNSFKSKEEILSLISSKKVQNNARYFIVFQKNKDESFGDFGQESQS